MALTTFCLKNLLRPQFMPFNSLQRSLATTMALPQRGPSHHTKTTNDQAKKEAKVGSKTETDKSELPGFCSKELAEECARKAMELHEQWKALAAMAGKPSEAPSEEGKQEQPRPNKPCGCIVKPPRRRNKGTSCGLLYLGTAIAALLAGGAFYLALEDSEEKDDDGDKEEEATA